MTVFPCSYISDTGTDDRSNVTFQDRLVGGRGEPCTRKSLYIPAGNCPEALSIKSRECIEDSRTESADSAKSPRMRHTVVQGI